MKPLAILFLLPMAALATGKPTPPQTHSHTQTPTSATTVTATSGSESDASAKAHADANSASQSSAITGASTSAATQTQTSSVTNSGNSTAQGGTATANNAGNTQSTEFNYPRQAPSTAQGSLMIGACGAGGNAGGSNTHGSAFLGIAWTPADCKLLLAAAAYQALGMYDSACEMVNGIAAVKARWKTLGVSPPSCQVKPPVAVPPAPPVVVTVPAPATVDTSQFVTRAELVEREKRQYERSVSK